MRWLSRSHLKGPVQGARYLISHKTRVLPRQCPAYPRATLSRGLSTSQRLQATAPSESTPAQAQKPNAKGPRWKWLALTFTLSATLAYTYGPSSKRPDDDVINTSSFSPFTITSREQVSPTAFILTLRPNASEDSTFFSPRITEAWKHGLWSVEIKQPQLQIARHYTPLPPRTDNDGDLRFLIRRMEGGEMSNYLSRQRVGDTIYLRGPHLGFDVVKRLGNAEEEKGVVFLAGGTGIAPALQIAHKVLESGNVGAKPRVSILWANRFRADALGRGEVPENRKSSWFGSWFWAQDTVQDTAEQQPGSSLANQFEDLKRRHPEHFEVKYFVDGEGSFIKSSDLKSALLSSGARGGSSIDKNCTWHSAKAVELLPDNNDAARSSPSDESGAVSVCTCPGAPGVNLLCISGPDGFIETYAGAKRWHDGGEMQGAIGGLIGKMLGDKREKVGEWLVLKL